MKTHHTVTIRVPRWLYQPYEDVRYFFRKWAYRAFPDRCSSCGARMHVRYFEIEHHFDNGQRLLVGNHAKSGAVCRTCIVKHLETGEWQPRFTHFHEEHEGKKARFNYRHWSTKKCDVTGKAVRAFKDVEVYPYIDMTFCTYAWNAGHVSKEAVIECVKNGNIKTSIWGIYKGKMVPMNHKRLFINDQGRLL